MIVNMGKKKEKKNKEGKKTTRISSDNKRNKKEEKDKSKVLPTGTHTDLKTLKSPSKYMTFVLFTAIPTVNRKESLGAGTQQELAKLIRVDEDTLTNWKKVAGFWEDVADLRQSYFKDKTGDVLLSLYNTCLKDGRGHDVKVFLNYTKELKDKYETEHTVTPELQLALERVAKVLG